MSHVVELVKPIEGDGESGIQKGERFDRGERIILVDGVRWGRTVVFFHGRRGPHYEFDQHGGERIMDDPNARRPTEVRVYTPRRNRYGDEPKADKGALVLAKARELVAAGKLRHPDVVKKKRDSARARIAESVARGQAREDAAFQARAIEAARPFGMPQSDRDALVARIVDAMRWAQDQ